MTLSSFAAKRWRAALIVIAACTVLCALGVWQLQRLAWKEQLIATLQERLSVPVVSLSRLPLPLSAQEWQRVSVNGRFDHAGQVLVGPRTREGRAGAHVFTPLRLDDGRILMINRGFVPMQGARLDAALSAPISRVTLSGVVRLPARARFTPDNDPARAQWYWPDLAAMHTGGGLIADIYVQQSQSATGEWPQAVSVTPDLPNNHAQYAAFWFAMAALALIVFLLAIRGRRR